MAENKKSFVAYSDWYGAFKAIPDEVAGKLIKHIFSYVNDEEPKTDDYVINALFEQIKSTLKRDLIKWEEQREQRSLAGKKSAEQRASKLNERSTVVNENERKSTVSVNVNDSVIVKESIEQRKLKFASSLQPYLLMYGKDLLNDFYGYWTQHGENDKKFLAEKQKSFGIERRLETWKRNEKNFNKQPLKADRL